MSRTSRIGMVDSGPGTAVFERIVCGVSASPASLEAVRQAARLGEPSGSVHLLAAVNLAEAAAAGFLATKAANELEQDAREALRRARELAPAATARLVDDEPTVALFAEIDRREATLVAVGVRRISRPSGILLGGVTATLLHEAPCSVLVARPCPDEQRFPLSIAVGVDGSSQSILAAAAAMRLCERFGAELHPLVALGGKPFDVERVRDVFPDVESDSRDPVDALVGAGRGTDLIVVGSRGLHGLRALGSVSERVAHRAPCSVLVIRPSRP